MVRLLAVLAGSLAVSAAQATPRDAAPPPNIVLIVTDDQGWWDLGNHGNEDIDTPSLDRLAAESVELTRFYVQPVCAPTRAGLMTGRHYLRTGLYNTRFGGDTLDLDETTIAEELRRAGYRTGLFGKWHLGEYRVFHPDQRGFEEAVYFTAGHVERYWEPDALLNLGRPVHARGHITDVLTEAASSFVRSRDERPFFLMLAYNVPHSPLLVADSLHEKYVRRGVSSRDARIYGLVEQCDAAIGRLLAEIDAEGLREETAVLFLSDNGGVSRHFRSGLRGGKGSVYEGGVRSPFYARWAGRFEAGRKVTERGSHLDIFPTLLELAGRETPARVRLDGRSLLPLLSGQSDSLPARRLFHIWDRFAPTLGSRWAVAGPRYKLVGRELYDLLEDPGEQRDLAADRPELARSMHEEFADWLADVTAGREFAPVAVPVGHPLEDPVDLYPSWAIHKGRHASTTQPYHRPPTPPAPLGTKPVEEATVYTFGAYYWDSISGWREPGESVRWKIDVVEAGRYEISLVYGCDLDDAGGEFELDAGGETLEGSVSATTGRSFYESRLVGSVSLPRGPSELRIRVVSAPGRDLMALNRVRIRRAPVDEAVDQ